MANKKTIRDIKNSPIPDMKNRPSKKDKPVIVKYRFASRGLNALCERYGHRPAVFGRYKNKDIAEKAIKDQMRKHPDFYEFFYA